MTQGNMPSVAANKSILSARQALICACVAEWAGDAPSMWVSPAIEADILAWAKSHSPTIKDEELTAAFQELLTEELFVLVCHPVFAQPVYYCSLDSNFLKELPDDICIGGAEFDIKFIGAFWEDFQERYFEEYGTTWLLWGLCAAQGSQGPSDSPWGPCLGCSCVCFTKGEAECNFGLNFENIDRSGWPDLKYLHHINADVYSVKKRETMTHASIVELKHRQPEFPWPH
ncbi:MAG: hypothetical protein WCS52_05800 [bacterium]